MNFKLAMIGLAALGSAALMSNSASAMPNGLPQAGHIAGETSGVGTSNVNKVRWVCNSWGRCHWQPNAYRSFGYYGPPRHHGWHHRHHHHPRAHHGPRHHGGHRGHGHHR